MKISNPYVYKVTEKLTGKFYIGKKVAKNKEGYFPVIGEEYFTSSSNTEFKKHFEEKPDDFICEIIKYGTNVEDTSFFESEEIYKEKDNPLILNRAIPGEFKGGSLQFIYDDKWKEAIKEGHKEIYKDKNSEKYKKMVETNRKIGEKVKQRNALLTQEEKNKIYGHKQTSETKKKISEASKKMWEKDPERNLIKKVIQKRTENGWHSNKGLVYPYKFMWISNGKETTRIKETDEIPDGWTKGRKIVKDEDKK